MCDSGWFIVACAVFYYDMCCIGTRVTLCYIVLHCVTLGHVLHWDALHVYIALLQETWCASLVETRQERLEESWIKSKEGKIKSKEEKLSVDEYVCKQRWLKIENNVQQICRTCRRLQTQTQALWQAGIFAKILMLAWVHQYANENKNGRLIACPPWKAGFDFDLDNSQWRAQSIIQDCSEDGNVMHGGHCFSL